jgi:hypothetical protein
MNDNGELDIIDNGLRLFFGADQGVPLLFTRRVMYRIQEKRFRNEMFLQRVLYSGLLAAGVLVIVATGFALGLLAS